MVEGAVIPRMFRNVLPKKKARVDFRPAPCSGSSAPVPTWHQRSSQFAPTRRRPSRCRGGGPSWEMAAM